MIWSSVNRLFFISVSFRRSPVQTEGTLGGNVMMKPEQQEIDRLRKEVAKLKAERDILKKAAAYFAREVT